MHQSYLGEPPLARLERLPKWLICIPLGLQWAYLGVRYRSFMLPTAANPLITAGGLVGETKTEYWQDAGPIAQRYLLPTIKVGQQDLASLAVQLAQAGIDFPIIIKPNLGLCGYGVRKVDTLAEAQQYWTHFPVDAQAVIQPFLPWIGEAGLFYWRHPQQPTGTLAGVALRYFPQVIGDGVHTVAELVAQSNRLQRLHQQEHASDLDWQYRPAAGEVVRLAYIGSTRIGGRYEDGSRYLTPQLAAVVDQILQDLPEFYFGRLDVRFESPDALARGEFKIIELNGAGSEAIEAWDPRYTWRQAFGTIFRKQAKAFEIGAFNRKRGYRPTSLWRVAYLNWQQSRLIRRYPPSN